MPGDSVKANLNDTPAVEAVTRVSSQIKLQSETTIAESGPTLPIRPKASFNQACSRYESHGRWLQRRDINGITECIGRLEDHASLLLLAVAG